MTNLAPARAALAGTYKPAARRLCSTERLTDHLIDDLLAEARYASPTETVAYALALVTLDYSVLAQDVLPLNWYTFDRLDRGQVTRVLAAIAEHWQIPITLNAATARR